MPLSEKFTRTFSAVNLTATHDKSSHLKASTLSFQLRLYEDLVFNFSDTLRDDGKVALAMLYAKNLCKDLYLPDSLKIYVMQAHAFYTLASQPTLSPKTANERLRDLLQQRRQLQVTHPTLLFPFDVQLNGRPIPLATQTPEELSAFWLAQTAHKSLYECKKAFLTDVLTHAKQLPHSELIGYLTRAANTQLARYQTTRRYLGCLWPWRAQTQQFLNQLILRCTSVIPLAQALKDLCYRQACFHIQEKETFDLSHEHLARDVVILR